MEKLLTTDEVAQILGVSVSSIRHGFGPPPLAGIGRRKRWHPEDVRAWIDARRRKDTAWDSTDAKAPATGGSASRTGAASTANRRGKATDPLLEYAPRRSKPKSEATPAPVIPLRPEVGRP